MINSVNSRLSILGWSIGSSLGPMPDLNIVPTADVLQILGFPRTLYDIWFTTPVINFFIASATCIFLDGQVMLTWSVSGADHISLNQGIGEVDSIGTLTVSPTADTVYILTAVNDLGTVQSSITITLKGKAHMLASDLIARALRTVGALPAGEPADANDIKNGLDTLNDMLDQWSLENLMAIYYKTEQFALISGQNTYTIGQGGGADFFAVRPLQIMAVQLRDSNGLDNDMLVVSFDEYQRLTQKGTSGSTPFVLCYQATYPNGTFYVYPTPDAGNSIRLQTRKMFTTLCDASDEVILPPGFNEAIVYNLAERFGIENGRDAMMAMIVDKAARAKANIKKKNVQRDIVHFDPALIGRQSGSYNPFTDS